MYLNSFTAFSSGQTGFISGMQKCTFKMPSIARTAALSILSLEQCYSIVAELPEVLIRKTDLSVGFVSG